MYGEATRLSSCQSVMLKYDTFQCFKHVKTKQQWACVKRDIIADGKCSIFHFEMDVQ